MSIQSNNEVGKRPKYRNVADRTPSLHYTDHILIIIRLSLAPATEL